MSSHAGSESSDLELGSDDGNGMSVGENTAIAVKETRAVNFLRIAAVTVLVSVAAVVCSLVFITFRDAEHETFKTEFSFLASRIIDSIALNAQQRLGALESFSTTITSFANATDASFPFVTIPDFEVRASYTQNVSQTIALLTMYFVADEDRDVYENYTVAKSDWMVEGLYYQAGDDQEKIAEVTKIAQNVSSSILPMVSVITSNGTGVLPAPRDDQTV